MFSVTILLIVFVVFCFYFWLIYAPHNHPNAIRLQGCYFAHRGLHDGNQTVTENSMKAFESAMENGYGIEADVQLTADDQLVIFHDASLLRVCHENLNIADITYEELCRYPLPDGTTIPLFTDFLKLVDGRVPLIIELKYYRKPAETAKFVFESLKDYQGPFCIESFHPLCLRWFRRNAPQIIRGQLAMGICPNHGVVNKFLYWIMSNLLLNFLGRPHFIAYEYAHDRHLSMRLMKKVFKPMLAAWTICDQQSLTEAMNSGYSMIIFEHFRPEN